MSSKLQIYFAGLFFFLTTFCNACLTIQGIPVQVYSAGGNQVEYPDIDFPNQQEFEAYISNRHPGLSLISCNDADPLTYNSYIQQAFLASLLNSGASVGKWSEWNQEESTQSLIGKFSQLCRALAAGGDIRSAAIRDLVNRTIEKPETLYQLELCVMYLVGNPFFDPKAADILNAISQGVYDSQITRKNALEKELAELKQRIDEIRRLVYELDREIHRHKVALDLIMQPRDSLKLEISRLKDRLSDMLVFSKKDMSPLRAEIQTKQTEYKQLNEEVRKKREDYKKEHELKQKHVELDNLKNEYDTIKDQYDAVSKEILELNKNWSIRSGTCDTVDYPQELAYQREICPDVTISAAGYLVGLSLSFESPIRDMLNLGGYCITIGGTALNNPDVHSCSWESFAANPKSIVCRGVGSSEAPAMHPVVYLLIEE